MAFMMLSSTSAKCYKDGMKIKWYTDLIVRPKLQMSLNLLMQELVKKSSSMVKVRISVPTNVSTIRFNMDTTVITSIC
eukprot:UN19437